MTFVNGSNKTFRKTHFLLKFQLIMQFDLDLEYTKKIKNAINLMTKEDNSNRLEVIDNLAQRDRHIHTFIQGHCNYFTKLALGLKQ